jgi:hypothetical protein
LESVWERHDVSLSRRLATCGANWRAGDSTG